MALSFINRANSSSTILAEKSIIKIERSRSKKWISCNRGYFLARSILFKIIWHSSSEREKIEFIPREIILRFNSCTGSSAIEKKVFSLSIISLHFSMPPFSAASSKSKFVRIGFFTLSANTELFNKRILFPKFPCFRLYLSLLTKCICGISISSFGGDEKTWSNLFTRPIKLIRSFSCKFLPLRIKSELIGRFIPSKMTLFAIIYWSSGICEYWYSKYSFTLSGIFPCK